MIRRTQARLEDIVEHLTARGGIGETATGVAIEQQGESIHGQFLLWGNDGATLAQHRMKKTPEAQGFIAL
ncbi:hypothetical protein VAWG002_32490 [Aeromonas veronii]|nr:hypothetical protein VAWG002_32490 [Aeromonas veronii]